MKCRPRASKERSTFYAYGGTESDYRPDRWAGFRSDYRFTGKEEDVEVGLTYFGKRYLSPQLGRWVSADPLGVHGLGGDLNLYAYVHGTVLRNVDPLGLTEPVQSGISENGEAALLDENGNAVASAENGDIIPYGSTALLDDNGRTRSLSASNEGGSEGAGATAAGTRGEGGTNGVYAQEPVVETPGQPARRVPNARTLDHGVPIPEASSDAGDIWLYQPSGAANASASMWVQWAADEPAAVEGGYSHGAVSIGGGQVFTAEADGSKIKDQSQEYTDAMKKGFSIDIYRHVDAPLADPAAMRAYAEARAGNVSYVVGSRTSRGEVSVCSSEAAAALTEGGPQLIEGGLALTSPNDLSMDSRLVLVGRVDGAQRMTVPAGGAQ